MYIVLFFRNVFYRQKKSILFIEITLHYFKQKTLEKNNITLYQRCPTFFDSRAILAY